MMDRDTLRDRLEIVLRSFVDFHARPLALKYILELFDEAVKDANVPCPNPLPSAGRDR